MELYQNNKKIKFSKIIKKLIKKKLFSIQNIINRPNWNIKFF